MQIRLQNLVELVLAARVVKSVNMMILISSLGLSQWLLMVWRSTVRAV